MKILLQCLKWFVARPAPTGHVERLEAVTTRIEKAGKRIENSADDFDEFGKMVVGMREKKKSHRAGSSKKKGPKSKC